MQVQRIQGTSYSLNRSNNANKNNNNVNFSGNFLSKMANSETILGVKKSTALGVFMAGAMFASLTYCVNSWRNWRNEEDIKGVRFDQIISSTPKEMIYEDMPVVEQSLPDGKIMTTYDEGNKVHIIGKKFNQDNMIEQITIKEKDYNSSLDKNITVDFKYDAKNRLSQRTIKVEDNISHDNEKYEELYVYTNIDNNVLKIRFNKYDLQEFHNSEEASLIDSAECHLIYNSDNSINMAIFIEQVKNGKSLGGNNVTDISNLGYIGGIYEGKHIINVGAFDIRKPDFNNSFPFGSDMTDFDYIPDRQAVGYYDQFGNKFEYGSLTQDMVNNITFDPEKLTDAIINPEDFYNPQKKLKFDLEKYHILY